MNYQTAIFMAFIFVFLNQYCCFSPPVLTLNIDGDVIDCFNVEEQPAFDNPLLKNHTIREPPELPKDMTKSTFKGQKWATQRSICPEKTVPIRRYNKTFAPIKSWPEEPPTAGHEYAYATFDLENEAFGTRVVVNVWSPTVEIGSEFTLSQIWLTSGVHDSTSHDLNPIEAGWQIYPDIYGDNRPRFFIYWTSDTYGTTGCYNTLCNGFVVTDNDFIIGGLIYPISSTDGAQFELTFQIWKDLYTRDWWLSVSDHIVGYWPADILTHLATGPAQKLQWGGEIINSRTFQRHTATQMGSGQFADQGYGKSSYFRKLMYVDYTNTLLPASVQITATDPNCYDAKLFANAESGVDMFYGGPGFNPMCN